MRRIVPSPTGKTEILCHRGLPGNARFYREQKLAGMNTPLHAQGMQHCCASRPQEMWEALGFPLYGGLEDEEPEAQGERAQGQGEIDE